MNTLVQQSAHVFAHRILSSGWQKAAVSRKTGPKVQLCSPHYVQSVTPASEGRDVWCTLVLDFGHPLSSCGWEFSTLWVCGGGEGKGRVRRGWEIISSEGAENAGNTFPASLATDADHTWTWSLPPSLSGGSSGFRSGHIVTAGSQAH